MVRQSSPPLRSFKIDSGYYLTSMQLLGILSWMPSLTNLSINVISAIFHEGFLAQLTYIPGSSSPTYTSEKSISSVLLPHLKSLEININFETNSRIAHSVHENHDNSLVDKLSHLTVLIPYFRDQSERVWAEGFCTTLKKRLQKYMNQGFTCTVTLGEESL
ncbi:hypothetical protein K435DRAFT_785071 [Dendrothele bispora CBS 962.96]|uniref:Uncharacterized protein n=1 Tax=Dendrothele bispora (strain CBS 962.96) TaxID=1314807 RepID=A0A4S8KZ03_DENBC|nr:hypothetical protein K435DRAFT_785071 [Dendrothele bispora CBS 962.96]